MAGLALSIVALAPRTVHAGPPQGLLAGPQVVDIGDDDDEVSFGGSGDRRGRRDVPAPTWFKVLDDLDLSRRQLLEIRAIRLEFRDARVAFRDTSGKRLKELLAVVRESRRSGDGLSAEEAFELERLEDARPSVEEYQLRIWFLLDEAQQEAMRQELQAARGRPETEAPRRGSS